MVQCTDHREGSDPHFICLLIGGKWLIQQSDLIAKEISWQVPRDAAMTGMPLLGYLLNEDESPDGT